MNKIFTIIQREYLSRVKKKSFLIMTILGPILMAGIMIGPVLLKDTGNETKKVIVVDHSDIFKDHFKNNEEVQYDHLEDIKSAKKLLIESDYYALVEIPEVGKNTGLKKIEKEVTIFSPKQVSLSIQKIVGSTIEKEIERRRLEKLGILPETIAETTADVNINTIQYKGEGKESKSSTLSSIGIGMFAGMLIYFFIFLYGTQVMRGVIEEKSNRIVEVIISSVKPFELMMGKIVGVAMVGLTQFLLWVVLTTTLLFTVQLFMTPDPDQMQQQMELTQQMGESDFGEFMEIYGQLDIGFLLATFLFFFLGGYLLYGSLFAAIGAAVDQETDSQQFLLPLTAPLILSFMVASTIVENPDGALAFWFSIIPLTSPIVMMVRLPFEVETWELLLSMSLLVLGFLGSTWLAGKIYRTGVLMYGKKVNYKELWKWIRYKN